MSSFFSHHPTADVIHFFLYTFSGSVCFGTSQYWDIFFCVRSINIFSDSPNPLLTQINFLESILGPECAAVSASAAAEALLSKRRDEEISGNDRSENLRSRLENNQSDETKGGVSDGREGNGKLDHYRGDDAEMMNGVFSDVDLDRPLNDREIGVRKCLNGLSFYLDLGQYLGPIELILFCS